jgi:hypothetical protein
MATLFHLKVRSSDATDFEICVSGGRVLAKVGNSVFCEVS